MALSQYSLAVREFANAFGHELDVKDPSDDLISLRWNLIAEEYREVSDEFASALRDKMTVGAVSAASKARLAKELGDLLYVVFGAAESLDIPIEVVYNRIHRSNMSKLGEDGKPVFREDGKVLKGPNYEPPNFSDLF